MVALHNCPDYPYQPIFFRQQQFRQDLTERPAITVFKSAIAGANRQFDQRFEEGEDIRFLISERATFVDVILHYAWYRFDWPSGVSLLAVGGYGRRELHPKSDIDILILLAEEADAETSNNLQNLITFLWDIGLEIGSSVRTLADCATIARDDITVATNLMEARRIAGSDRLRDQLQIAIGPDRMWSMQEFFTAKVKEQHERHKRFNFTEYDLEPNIKNGPGGLRDIQTINWLAKRYYGVRLLRELNGKNFFTELEFGLLRKNEAFLWRVRYGLHRLTKRPEERLLFEYQRALAEQFGYRDKEELLAVEQFMSDYYRTVQAVRDLSQVLLRLLEEYIFEPPQGFEITPLNENFQVRGNYLEVRDPLVFERRPSALLECFLLLGEHPEIRGLRAATSRLIRESVGMIDARFREDPVNNALFMRILRLPRGVVSQLKQMKRTGILGRYLPEFGRIVGQMQHDLFHRYTVDAHTLLVLQNIRRFGTSAAEQQVPIAAQIFQQLQKPELLYIAALYHDIGKGRGGDHSELGAVDAENFCRRHGLSARETRLVVWLVRHHLLMSYVSQKKDIADPDVVHAFAKQVGDHTYLDHLYVLTVADMRGTNPNIWNSWRASLMRELYSATKSALRRGLEAPVDQAEIIAETQAKALTQLAEEGLDPAQVRGLWAAIPAEYFVRETAQDIAWHTGALAATHGDSTTIALKDSEQLPWIGATQIFISTPDSEYTFVAVATAIAQQHLNVQDARFYGNGNGQSYSTFYVLDESYLPFGGDSSRLAALRKALASQIAAAEHYTGVAPRRVPRQLKQMATPTRTKLYTDPGAPFSVLEVISPDRPGLLATIGRVFLEYGIRLRNAKISTLGERVEDVFFICDRHGKPLLDSDLANALQAAICAQLDRQVEQEY